MSTESAARIQARRELVSQARVMVMAKLTFPQPAYSNATDWTVSGLCSATGMPQVAVMTALAQLKRKGAVNSYKLDGFIYYTVAQ